MPGTISIQTESAKLSEEQFFLLCSENKEIRFERDKHKNIIILSPTGSYTGYYHSRIIYFLERWNEEKKSGCCFDSSAGFTLSNGAVRNPDAAWMTKERWEKIPLYDKERFAHICPDFVIEVRSKTDSLKTLQNKMQEWLDNGCRLGWLIDLGEQKIYVYKPTEEIKITNGFDNLLSGQDVLPGFELDLKELKA